MVITIYTKVNLSPRLCFLLYQPPPTYFIPPCVEGSSGVAFVEFRLGHKHVGVNEVGAGWLTYSRITIIPRM